MYLIVDMSRAMEEKDLSPSRGLLTLSLLETFITEFFDQNPISQLGIIVTRNANMEKLTDLGGNPADHIRALRQNVHFAGEPSLQKSLNLAHTLLKCARGKNRKGKQRKRESNCVAFAASASFLLMLMLG